MEIFPIFDENSKITKNIWYSISGDGESPFMRVGHSIVHTKDNSPNSKGKFYIIGGANPSGSFNDVSVLDMDTLSWDKFDDDLENFEKGRYEHACLLDNQNNQILIFGGSNEDGALNDFLKFDIDKKKCLKFANESQNTPSPRTCHVGVSYKNQLIIYGGGNAGKSPILDQKLYIFNPTNSKWISLNIQGNLPEPRQGHLMINSNDNLIYLHGGMNNEMIYDDLWALDIKKMTWSLVELNKEETIPVARAAHGGISVNDSLYIFGGIGTSGEALDDLWKYDTVLGQWTNIEIFGYKPPPRLDFAYCKAEFKIRRNVETKPLELNSTDASKLKEDEDSTPSSSTTDLEDLKEAQFLVVHGGMDTEGNVYDDIFMINLE